MEGGVPKDGGSCRRHHLGFSQDENQKKDCSPQASSRKLAIGLHVMRPSGAARPRGRSALVVLRREIEHEETLTPKGVRVSKKRVD